VRTIWGRRGRIVKSDRRGRRVDVVGVHNPYRRPLTAFVVVSTHRTLDAGYRLTMWLGR
jgi:hypothetical protein